MNYLIRPKINTIHETTQKGKPMPFKNEYVLPIEQETSNFFIQAQKIINVTAERRSKWTIDRENEMVLVYKGSGRETQSANHDLWEFLDRKGRYVFSTDMASKTEVSPEEIAITHILNGFWVGGEYATPDTASLTCIKDALREYKDWGVISDYKHCCLTLIDSRTGEEI